MLNILSEGRKIETRRQLEKLAIVALRSKRKVEELETTQERRPVNDHIDVRAGVFGMDSI